MAIYYALVEDGFIKKDIRTGQLEIYEKENDALRFKEMLFEVVEVEVKRTKDTNHGR